MGDAFRGLSSLDQRLSQPKMRQRRVRLQRQVALIRQQRLIEPALDAKRVAESAMNPDVVRRDGEQPVEQRDGLLRLFPVAVEQGAEVEKRALQRGARSRARRNAASAASKSRRASARRPVSQ